MSHHLMVSYTDTIQILGEGTTRPTRLKSLLLNSSHLSNSKPPKRTLNVRTKGYLYEVREWGRNNAKWKAAKTYCEKKDMDFLIWTEKDLGL